MCIWEGAADWYRDMTHHGGILSTFWANWYDMQVKTVQYGLGERGPRSPVTGELVCGDVTLAEKELYDNRCDFGDDILAHPLDDAYHKARSAVWEKITVPFLSAANWGGQGLHPRGNFEGFVRAASKDKWLEAHGIEHWTHFYTDYGVKLQKRFFDHFLKGADNGWTKQPRVQLQVRHVDRFVERHEGEWPIARTQWTKFYLNPVDHSLSREPVKASKSVTYDALGDGVTFVSAPLDDRKPRSPGRWRPGFSFHRRRPTPTCFSCSGCSPRTCGRWCFRGRSTRIRRSRKGGCAPPSASSTPKISTEYRPYHTHDEIQPLTPGEAVPLEVELWPTSIVVPAGHRIALTVRGRDYEWGKATGARLSNFKNELRGCGPFLHDDPRDRPAAVFGGNNTLHTGPEQQCYILVPVVPVRD